MTDFIKGREMHFCHCLPAASRFLIEGHGREEKILLVGESLTLDWVRYGSPFVKISPSIRNLNDLFRDIDLDADKMSFTNLAKCYLGTNRKKITSCGLRCLPVLEKQLLTHDFKLIITLGVTTLSVFQKTVITKLTLGEMNKIKIGRREYSLLPIYHPSPLSRSLNKNKQILTSLRNEIVKTISSRS